MSAFAFETDHHRDRPEPFLAFVADDVTAAVLARVAGGRGWNPDRVVRGSPAEAVEVLSSTPTPGVLVVDLSGQAEPLAAVNALADVCEPGVRLVAVGDVNDVGLYRALIGLGVADYLLKPVTAESLAAALDAAAARATKPEPDDSASHLGRLIALVGARGGVGATTVAAGVAWLLAHEHGRRTALVDLDLFFGSVALTLDLEPGRGFREALEAPSRIDGLFLERALVRAGERLFVLGAEEPLEKTLAFDPAALDLLLEKLRHGFDAVVLDMPRFAARTQAASLSPPSALAVVSDPSLAGMRDTLRLVKLFRAEAPDTELSLVLNRVGFLGQGELDADAFAKGAECAVDVSLPFDGRTLARCAATGKTVGEAGGRCRAGAGLRDLARRLSGTGPAAAPSLLDRLMRRRA